MRNTAVSKAGLIAFAMLFSAVSFAGTIHLKVYEIGSEVRESRALAAGSLALVEWKNAVRESEKAELEKLGGEILGFVPDNTFLVHLKSATSAQVGALPFVERVLAYSPEMKIDTDFARVQLRAGNDPVWAFVELIPGSRPEKVADYLLIPH